MRPGFFFKAFALVLSCFIVIGDAEARNCTDFDPAKERPALSAYLKKTGYNQKQIAFVLRFADGRTRAWREFPLNERGRSCGVKAIAGSIYGCVVFTLPDLLRKSGANIHDVVKDESRLKVYGVKQLTSGEIMAGAAVGICQIAAADTFAQR